MLFLAPASVRADDLSDFEAARALYERHAYARAVSAFSDLVESVPPRLSDRLLILESRKYLAASLSFVGAADRARSQFRLLLQQEPSYALDPLAFPSEVVELFAEVKAETQAARAAQQAREREQQQRTQRLAEQALARDHQNLLRLRQLAEEGEREVANSRWIASIPFGVGQFQNGHKALGVVLAMAEGLAAAGSVASYIAHQRLADARPEPDQLAATRRVESLSRTTNIASFSIFALLALTGIIDAHVRFVPGRVTSQKRPLPDDLDRWLQDHALSPQGLLIRF